MGQSASGALPGNLAFYLSVPVRRWKSAVTGQIYPEEWLVLFQGYRSTTLLGIEI